MLPYFRSMEAFSIYPYPKIGSHYLTANSNISSRCSRIICQWKEFSLSVCSNGQT